MSPCRFAVLGRTLLTRAFLGCFCLLLALFWNFNPSCGPHLGTFWSLDASSALFVREHLGVVLRVICLVLAAFSHWDPCHLILEFLYVFYLQRFLPSSKSQGSHLQRMPILLDGRCRRKDCMVESRWLSETTWRRKKIIITKQKKTIRQGGWGGFSQLITLEKKVSSPSFFGLNSSFFCIAVFCHYLCYWVQGVKPRIIACCRFFDAALWVPCSMFFVRIGD